jgi:hypothetical protein
MNLSAREFICDKSYQQFLFEPSDVDIPVIFENGFGFFRESLGEIHGNEPFQHPHLGMMVERKDMRTIASEVRSSETICDSRQHLLCPAIPATICHAKTNTTTHKQTTNK